MVVVDGRVRRSSISILPISHSCTLGYSKFSVVCKSIQVITYFNQILDLFFLSLKKIVFLVGVSLLPTK